MKNSPKFTKALSAVKGMSAKIDQQPFKRALGDQLYTSIDPTPVGKHRLQSALKERYGANFRNHPDAKQALDHMDQETKRVTDLVKIRTGKI